MQKKDRSRQIIVMVIMLFAMILPSSIKGSSMVHNTIRIGLRGNYTGVNNVAIKNTTLHVGYEKGDQFTSQAKLQSTTGFVIRPSNQQYYATRDVFDAYHDAVDSLVDYIDAKPVVVYMAPDTWRIYVEKDLDHMNTVVNSGHEVVVEDGYGTPLLVCPNAGLAPAFAGDSDEQSFYLTELSKSSYRGWFEFMRQGNTVMPINIVEYEDYLYGVIAAEMPASWNMEALKAQAVVARSMSIHQYNKYIKDGYNVCDTTFTQVYKGFNGEHPRTNQAVNETRGLVAMYGGKVAETLYFSTSGGHTEDPIYVWGNLVPYLKAVADPYETEPEMKPWTRRITLADLDLCLQKQNINIGQARGLRINEYTPAGRANEIEIIGINGTHKITRENIRTFFTHTKEGSLRSRMFTIDSVAPIEPSLPSQSSKQVVVHGSRNLPQYIIGKSGKVQAIGDYLAVEGPKGKIVYGSNTGEDKSQSVYEQYGDITISGQGFGHGVGMSQSGARGMAKEGYTYNEIIEYYYPGVSLK